MRCGLVLNDLAHLGSFHRGGAQKLRETLVARGTNISFQAFGADLVTIEKFLQRFLEQLCAVGLIQPALAQRHHLVAGQGQRPVTLWIKQSYL